MCSIEACTTSAAQSPSDQFLFRHCAAIVSFLQVLSFYKTKKKKDAMECVSNAGIWEMFLCEMDRFPFFVPPTDGNALALLHGPPLASERVFTGVHSLLLQIFYLLLLTTSSLS